MNSYSWIEKKLHQIALSKQFIREVEFDIESSLFSSKILNDNHVFIAGLARSGTTILLNTIYQSSLFASLTYMDMPFVLAPNLWSKISLQKDDFIPRERAHGDGINFSLKSPEAFEEVFWKTFPDYETESIEKFKIYIDMIVSKYKKERYLSKNNQNIKRIFSIAENFPNSKILIPYREPIQHAFSLLTQHNKFIDFAKEDKFISNYMKLIGHTEFGPNYNPISKIELNFKNYFDLNHWIEQWYLNYKTCLKNIANKRNVYFISYEKLCKSKKYWLEILEILEIKNKYNFEFTNSFKDITLKIDKKLKDKSISLYLELNELDF